jgi:hypothetical protein
VTLFDMVVNVFFSTSAALSRCKDDYTRPSKVAWASDGGGGAVECRQVGGTEIAERSHGSAEPGRGFAAAAQHPVAGRATRPQAAEGPCRPRGNAGAPTSSTPLADTVTARPVKSSTYGSPTVKDCVIELGPDAGQPASCAVIWAAVHAVSAWAGRPLPFG